MKKLYPLFIFAIIMAFSVSMTAQETKVLVKVTRDGKVVKDTTYQFEDEARAEHVLKVMGLMSGEDLEEIHEDISYSMSHGHGGDHKTMVFVSKDGDNTVIKKIHADSLDFHGEKVIVMESKDGATYKIITKSNADGDVEKKVNVWVSDDEDIDIEKYMEEGEDHENVKVIVIKKEIKDCDHDHDKDCDHEEEVEIEVKKVKKKSKKQ